MLRLTLEILLGVLALGMACAWGFSRMKRTDRVAQHAPEEAEGNALASASRSDFETRRLRKSGPKGFQKRPTDGTAA